ncbi:hypothetical protein SC020_13330 [Legionella pneumophila serogroup 1]|nr:hypothetical protein [Legionella pneumophila]
MDYQSISELLQRIQATASSLRSSQRRSQKSYRTELIQPKL